MGETQNILNFRPAAGLTNKQINEGVTVVEATHAGETYRVIGTITDPMRSGRRTFRAYRVIGEPGKTALFPAASGGEHKTRKAAIEQADADLADVLRDRRAVAERETPSDSANALGSRLVEVLAAHDENPRPRKLRGPAHAHLDAPCTDACYEPAAGERFEVKIDVAGTEADLLAMVRKAVRRAVPAAPATDPATEDDSNEMLDRIVRRAQYTALCEVLAQLDYRLARYGQRVCVADIRRMVNDAADELRVPQPYRSADE